MANKKSEKQIIEEKIEQEELQTSFNEDFLEASKLDEQTEVYEDLPEEMEGIGAIEGVGSVYSPRLVAPSASDANWRHTSVGGKNSCILIANGSVLPNCVGYAWGRWIELLGHAPKLSRGNAENWYGYNDGYDRGNKPKLGAVICWRKGLAGNAADGAGHVAIVEQIKADGTVVTSNSGYGGTRFWIQTIKPPYNIGTNYHFQGFIYNPTVKDETIAPAIALKYKVGDVVRFTGVLYANSYGGGAGASRSGLKSTITLVNEKGTKPYNINNGLGWVSEDCLEPYTKPAKPINRELAIGDKVRIKGVGNGSSYGSGKVAGGIGWTREILNIWGGRAYPYQIGIRNQGTTGFYSASALERVQ